ncbi:MAG: hypothetical protein HC764_17795 [Pleurocapsa sp. CRU_1_2]|nr:hypothetical protein [Pleurocapsa sp. CRU_1_2]
MTQYLIDIPNQDPSLPWMIIKTFNHQDLATAFAQRTWQATNGLFCLIAYEQQYFNVRVPNPNFFSSTQPFLFVEGFNTIVMLSTLLSLIMVLLKQAILIS